MKEVHDEVMKVVVHEAKIRFVQYFVKNGHSFFSQTIESSLSFRCSLLLISHLNFRLFSVDRYKLESNIFYFLIFFGFSKLNILHHMHARISEIIFDDIMRENDEGALALL